MRIPIRKISRTENGICSVDFDDYVQECQHCLWTCKWMVRIYWELVTQLYKVLCSSSWRGETIRKLNDLYLAQKFHTWAQHQTILVAKLLAVSETFNFESRISLKNMLQQFMKLRNHIKTERLGSCPKVLHLSTTWNYSGSQTLSSIWDIQFWIKNSMEEHVAAVHEVEKPFENWTTRILPKSFTHELIKLFW